VAFANSEGRKSTTGYVYLAGGGAITWMSKKQSVVALSSTDAEYVALPEAGREACWLKSLYHELAYDQAKLTQISVTTTEQLRWRAIHSSISEPSISTSDGTGSAIKYRKAP
jgi:hypothetical protein